MSPVAEPAQNQGPHASWLERDPHLKLDASVQMVRVGVGGKIEDVGWLCPPTEIERRRSLIKGETGRWGRERQRWFEAGGFLDRRAYGMSARGEEEGCKVEGSPQ